jgi:predicted pyridoxine 5'-phosphate oxidase superfamily flavin-nucleotide-binding protein
VVLDFLKQLIKAGRYNKMLTGKMRELLQSGRCFVATAAKDGWPNLGPKGSVVILDDFTLAFAEATGKQTYKNLIENPKVAVAVYDYENAVGFRFLGTADLERSGELFDRFAQIFAAKNRPHPLAAVRIKLEAIYDVSAQKRGEKVS